MDLNVKNVSNIDLNNNTNTSSEVSQNTGNSDGSIFDDSVKENKEFIENIKDKYNKFEKTLKDFSKKLSKDAFVVAEELSLNENVDYNGLSNGFSLNTEIEKLGTTHFDEDNITLTNQFKISKSTDLDENVSNLNLENNSNIRKEISKNDEHFNSLNMKFIGTFTPFEFQNDLTKKINIVNKEEPIENKSIKLTINDAEVFRYKLNNNITNDLGVYNKQTITDNNFSHSISIGDAVTYNNVIETDNKQKWVIKNIGSSSVGFTYNSQTKNVSEIVTGVSTSLTYIPSNRFNISLSGNGNYVLSTGKDRYSFGSGLKMEVQPFAGYPDFRLYADVEYSQSDFVSSDNSKNLNQEVSLEGKLKFNKHFSTKVGYDYHIDNNKDNSLSFGITIK